MSKSCGNSARALSATSAMHLLPGRLPLLVFQPPLEHAADHLAASCSSCATPNSCEELVRQLRQADGLDVLDDERGLDRLAAKSRVGDGVGQGDVDVPRLARLGPLHLLAEVGGHAVLEPSCGSTRMACFLDLIERLVALQDRRDVGRDDVADFDFGRLPSFGTTWPYGLEQRRFSFCTSSSVNVCIGRLSLRPL